MTAFQAVDKGSIPLSRTIMRIRNYLFLGLALVIIGVLDFANTNSSSSLLVKSELITVSSVVSSESDKQNSITPSFDGDITTSSSDKITSNKTSSTKTVALTPVSNQKVFKLDVPYFSQQYANSCEAASLRMALAYYSIEISDDMDIVEKFGYNPRDKDITLDEWDNPQEMFVGNIDIVGSTKGYGVYGKPVMKAVLSYGRDASYETNINAQFLAKELKAGHPVILWGYTSITAPAYTWNLSGGGEVTAFKGEHARLVIGFSGDVENPTGFYIHDPFNGNKSEYWSTNKLMNQVNAVPGVTNQAVVVK